MRDAVVLSGRLHGAQHELPAGGRDAKRDDELTVGERLPIEGRRQPVGVNMATLVQRVQGARTGADGAA